LYIYAIASGPTSIKIGYSADPEKRLGQLQIGHEKKLVLIHKEPVSPEQAPLLEKRVHQSNRHKALRGEWFRMSPEEAIGEIQFAVIRYSSDE
jgi:Meiotically up-regulated gene 113